MSALQFIAGIALGVRPYLVMRDYEKEKVPPLEKPAVTARPEPDTCRYLPCKENTSVFGPSLHGHVQKLQTA